MALSPMMRQYLEIKEQYKDGFLFFRLGDFYEMFFDDAVKASKELELTLTGKDCGLEERAPMCGVPYHAAETYIQKLIEKGYKVLICEQLEDPATAKGLVKRGIVRIITPGTVSDMSMLNEGEANYILSVCQRNQVLSVSYADVSTGAFFCEETSPDSLDQTLFRIRPKEILYPSNDSELDTFLKKTEFSFYLTPYEQWPFQHSTALKTLKEHFRVNSMNSFGLKDDSVMIDSAGALMQYLMDTSKTSLTHFVSLKESSDGRYMILDTFTRRNLEITETMRDKEKKGSLLGHLDRTKTAMGSRLLKSYVEQPLLNPDEIDFRLDCVEAIKNDLLLRTELRDLLDEIYDIERLLARLSYGNMDARDAVMLRSSIAPLSDIEKLISGSSSMSLKMVINGLDPLEDLYTLLMQSIGDNPPVGLREGGFIREGYNEELDRLRFISHNGKDLIKEMEARERELTGIKTLKIGYNRVFGYYIDVTNSFRDMVPERYIRRQTLTGSERYITEELKKIEDELLTSEDRANKLEYSLFEEIRDSIASKIHELQKDCSIISELDFYQSLAQVAYDFNYVRPKITVDGVIDIKNGRHPVVEAYNRADFIPNDCYMDNDDDTMLIITGPNMAGKSTFMRQTGLIVLMAQIGSFVPASKARIGIVDRIFTRVGASDDLSSGQSTFMMEMNELASILNNATPKSLVILDEIGRGTSTLDGLSIAWATIEYILGNKKIRSKTLFATHYHELISLENTLKGIRNYSVAVKELNKEVIFLHKIVKGGTDKSFGIEVAKLAGLPEEMLDRARGLLRLMEKESTLDISKIDTEKIEENEDPLREEEKNVLEELRHTDVNSITPFEALSILNDMKHRLG